MIKNKSAQLVFQIVYCVLGVIGILNSVGYFAADFNENFFVYYTNLSNYICIGVMFAMVVSTYKSVKNKEDGYCNVMPSFTFLCVILILVTFLVYNILLADENTVVQYFTSQSNMLMHVILPIMFILNWILFYKHPSLKWYHPVLSVIMPLVYVVFIVIRANFVKGDINAVVYPYFFLDVDKLGWGGFFAWVLILLAIFIAIGYLLYLLDRVVFSRKKG